MTNVLALEPFDNMIEAANSPTRTAYDEGYQAGYEAAKIITQQSTDALSDALSQTLADISFTYSEARADVLKSLGPLFDTVSERILPNCITLGFPTLLSDSIHDFAARISGEQIVIHVHPDKYDAITNTLADLPNVCVCTDAKLTSNAAWVCGETQEQHLNFDQLLTQITEIIHAIQPYNDRKSVND